MSPVCCIISGYQVGFPTDIIVIKHVEQKIVTSVTAYASCEYLCIKGSQ